MAANLQEENGAVSPPSFTDFPEDVQLCILSFLTPAEISAFACTSKRFVSLCRDDERLWFSMCDRRWGSKTLIAKWGNGEISYKLLYMTLLEYEHLIGFWRRSGTGTGVNSGNSGRLVFFEWGPFYVSGSWVTPVKTSSYKVIKSPFLWMGINSKGETVNYLDLEGRLEFSENFMSSPEDSWLQEKDLVAVYVSFIGTCHVAIEENVNSSSPKNGDFRKVSSSGNVVKEDEYEDLCGSPGSLPDRPMSEIYQYFANRISPGGNGSWRRQRRREKERQGRRKWDMEHFVKIVDCSPTPARPLQGLWKGISDDRSLEFYLVSYDNIGGITCRRVGELSQLFSGCTLVFWTSNATFIESPFTSEEEDIYMSREHLQPYAEGDSFDDCLPCSDNRDVMRMLSMNSSYDLVIPDLTGTNLNPRQVEGRIWQYGNGTFGFGFLRNDYIIDLKQIARDGHILDIINFSDD
nr:F-box protein At3g12350 [Ipomoea batatas]